jgi:hypothetical protein
MILVYVIIIPDIIFIYCTANCQGILKVLPKAVCEEKLYDFLFMLVPPPTTTNLSAPATQMGVLNFEVENLVEALNASRPSYAAFKSALPEVMVQLLASVCTTRIGLENFTTQYIRSRRFSASDNMDSLLQYIRTNSNKKSIPVDMLNALVIRFDSYFELKLQSISTFEAFMPLVSHCMQPFDICYCYLMCISV